jgi:antitoxin PrlF
MRTGTRPTTKSSNKPAGSSPGPVEYLGKRIKTGNSTGFRFEGALFKSHPEFSGEVRARVIAPGRLLVTAEPADELGGDPIIASFLAFVAQDMLENPQLLRPFDRKFSDEIASLVDGMSVDRDEDLGGDSLV